MFRRLATSRNVLFFLVFGGLLWLAQLVFFTPGYRAVASGFPPMNVQFPLSAAMMAFQRGAFGPGLPLAALQYATVDYLIAANYAFGLGLLWCWMADRSNSPLLERSIARGLLLFPLILAGLDWAENSCFLLIAFANPRDPQHDLTATTLMIHNARHVALLVNQLVTLWIAAIFGLASIKRGRTNVAATKAPPS